MISMLIDRFIFSSLLRILLILNGFSAFAQMNFEPGAWVDDLFILGSTRGHATLLIDENNVIKQEIPFVTSIVDFPVPQKLRTLSGYPKWYQDGLYTVTFSLSTEKDANGSEYRQFSFTKWHDNEWRYLGSYKYRNIRAAINAIPCDNEQFIVASSRDDLSGDTGPNRTPFAKMSLAPNSEEVRFVSVIDHGQDEIRRFMSETNCFELAYLSRVIITGDRAVRLNYNTGLYWVFSLEKATLIKAGNIFDIKKMTPEIIAKGGVARAILCAHPEKGGTVLISAQIEEALTTVYDLSKELTDILIQHNVGRPNATMSAKDYFELRDKRRKELAEQNPMIVWYRIYPENGRVEKLALAPEGAAIDREGGKNDLWRPMPDGSVKMGPVVLAEDNSKRQDDKQETAVDLK